MILPEMQSVAIAFIERLLNSTFEGIVLAGLVYVFMRFIRRENSGTRFVIWFCAMLAIVALPFCSGVRTATAHLRFLPSDRHGEIVISSTWALGIFIAWAVIAGMLLARLGIGLWRLHKYRSACSKVDLDFAIDEILRDFAFRRRVTVLASDAAAVPSAVGFFRSAIVFPAWLLPKLSPEELRLILLHELAHLRRWDDWTNLAQKVIRAVFFLHPAVWWIEHHLTLEREMACDDMVLAQTATPRAYASSLISFAEKLQDGRALALAQTLLGRMQQLSPRVKKILDANHSRSVRLGWTAVALSSGMLAALVGATSFMPRMIAFRSESSAGQAQTVRQLTTAAEHPANLTLAHAVEVPIASHALQPRAISAAFRSRTSNAPFHVNPKQPHPLVIKRATILQQPPQMETFMILRTTQFDDSGRAVWTFCVWRVSGEGMTTPMLDSAIFVGLI
jgi:beta-lactamase regulating signal transducer with metallopeptidase domain